MRSLRAVTARHFLVKEAERPTAGNVINLVEAPKRSIEGTATAKGKRPAAGRSGEQASDAMQGLLEIDDRLAAGMCRVVEGIVQ